MLRNWWQTEDFFFRSRSAWNYRGGEEPKEICIIRAWVALHARLRPRDKLPSTWVRQIKIALDPSKEFQSVTEKVTKKIRVVSCHTPTQTREKDWLWTLWKTWWIKSDYGLLVMDTSVEETKPSIQYTTQRHNNWRRRSPIQSLKSWITYGAKNEDLIEEEVEENKKALGRNAYPRSTLATHILCLVFCATRVEINAPIMFSFKLQEMDPKRLDRSDERLTSTKIYSLLLYLVFWTVTKSINGYSGWFPKCPSYPLPQNVWKMRAYVDKNISTDMQEQMNKK